MAEQERKTWQCIDNYFENVFDGAVAVKTDPKYGDPGRMVVAMRDFEVGEIIGREPPLIVLPRDNDDMKQMLFACFENTLKAFQSGAAPLVKELCWREDLDEIVRENCESTFTVLSELNEEFASKKDFVELCVLMNFASENLATVSGENAFVNVFNSLRNHNIDSNTASFTDDDMIGVHFAARDIKKGEELTFNYLGDGTWDRSVLEQYGIPLTRYETMICNDLLDDESGGNSFIDLKIMFQEAPPCRLQRRILFCEETDDDWQDVDRSLVTIEACLLALDIGNATGDYTFFKHLYECAKSTKEVRTDVITFWPTWMAIGIVPTGFDRLYLHFLRNS